MGKMVFKGLSHKMDLAFDDMHGQIQAQIEYEDNFLIFQIIQCFYKAKKCISRAYCEFMLA